jgi:TetR/AcrR family transcriptional regulator, transcriptional repressor for nem operon
MKPIDTKTQILDVAQELIQRLGVNGMSYQDISDRVGIRKASIHSHFPKKDDLIVALLDRYNARFLRIVDGIGNSEDSPEGKLRRYCELFTATLGSGDGDRACLCAMLGAELATLSPDSIERIRRFYEANEERLEALLNAGRQDGSFRFPGQPQTLAALVFGSLQGGMFIARVHGGAPRLQATIEQLVGLVKG